MDNTVFIDLDKENSLPELTSFQGIVNIKRNGRLIVKNSILENIDTYSEEELRYILVNLKPYISPIVTSQYIPSKRVMRILNELAPEFKVRFKTEKSGGTPIVPISCKEFFEGEEIFGTILKEMNPSWTEKQKYRYLYNSIGSMLSYDLNLLAHTEYSGLHDKYARNIFTAMSKNWGICSSFAAGYDYLCYRSGLESQVLSEDDHDYVIITDSEEKDYLTDPTFDSVALKFGMKTKNFGIPKEKFKDNGHDLKAAEVDDYEFDSLGEEEIRQLDISTGYLDNFGGEYTDEFLSTLANNLEGNNNFEKILNFLERIKNIKTVGRPSAHDFESILKFILSKSNDRTFKQGINTYSFISELSRELPRNIAIEVTDGSLDENTQYYVLQDGLKSWMQVEKIEKIKEYKER